MEDHRVPDQLITASSYYNYWGSPRMARLHQRRVGKFGGSWYAKRNDKRQWLKVDMGGLTRVSRCATQGRQNADQWVTSYYVSYSVKGYRFVTYKEYGRTKVSKISNQGRWGTISLTSHFSYSLLHTFYNVSSKNLTWNQIMSPSLYCSLLSLVGLSVYKRNYFMVLGWKDKRRSGETETSNFASF